MRPLRALPLLLLPPPISATTPLTLNTFDGPGFPSGTYPPLTKYPPSNKPSSTSQTPHLPPPFPPLPRQPPKPPPPPPNTNTPPPQQCTTNITAIHTPPSIPALASLIRTAAASGHRVRAAGAGHSWYDTQCSSDTSVQTVILRTDALTGITDLVLPAGEGEGGTVVVEAGVTFFQLAAYLHDRGASVGYALTNWNITFGGAVAMGAHRSSLREASMVADGAEGVEIVDATGERRWVERGDGTGEEWAAASTSLGLLGVIVRVRMRVQGDTKVFAMQKTWVLLFSLAVLGL